MIEDLSEQQRLAEVGRRFKSLCERGYCSHSKDGTYEESCEKPAIRSHTITRHTLGSIAEDGHVSRFNVDGMGRKGIFLERVGVNRVSVFRGFCDYHDKVLFSPLEDFPFVGSDEQVGLLSYRSCCHELFKKRVAEKLLHRYLLRLVPDENKAFVRASLWGYRIGIKRLIEFKLKIQKSVDVSEYSEHRSLIFRFDRPLPFLCSSTFNPEATAFGKKLQDYTDLSSPLDVMSMSAWNSKEAGYIVFGWLSECKASLEFAQSLMALRKKNIPNYLLNMMFEHCENICFSTSWWEALSERNARLLMQRVGSGICSPPRGDEQMRFDGQSGAGFSLVSISGRLR